MSLHAVLAYINSLVHLTHDAKVGMAHELTAAQQKQDQTHPHLADKSVVNVSETPQVLQVPQGVIVEEPAPQPVSVVQAEQTSAPAAAVGTADNPA